MPAFVVRHAEAGDRWDWEGDDRFRTLTNSGRRQAEALAEQFKDDAVDQILSSPYVRCLQTVEPLARSRRLTVEPEPRLIEGSGGAAIVALIKRHGGRNLVLCTHGDIVEELLELLIDKGLLSRSRVANEKAGIWVLEAAGAEITAAAYRPPPEA